MSLIRRRKRQLILVCFLAVIGIPVSLIGADALVGSVANERCFVDSASLPTADVGLVLGTNPKVVGGFPNHYYELRLDAAARLFRAGKVRYLLVSGDNGTRGYDEPTAMRQDLIKRGVPAAAIFCDYAGFRTLDSIVRANKVFGQQRFTIISQHFHNERAHFIARSAGLDAYAFDAEDPTVPPSIAAKMWWRERFARLTAVLDTRVWGRKPRFLGKREYIGPTT